MVSAAAVGFLALAGLTFVGFLAGRFFEKTRFPDIPILLGLGLLAGPVNRYLLAKGSGWPALGEALSPEKLQDAAPFVAGLALVVLLFDSGMALDFQAFRRSLGPAFRHTMPILILTVLAVTAVCHYLLGMPMVVAAIFAVAACVVDQTVSAGTLDRMRISDDVRATYFVEMAFYDLLSIPLIVALITSAGGEAAGQGIVPAFAGLTAISLALGIGTGLAWAYALRRLRGHPHSYMLTFATTLAVYGLSEALGGSGALSLLLFGLIVGNRTWILKRFGHLREVDGEHQKVQAFHDEITFFVRTLYFLFLGASVTPSSQFTWPSEAAESLAGRGALGTGLGLIAIATLLVSAVIIAARYLPVRLAALGRPERKTLFPVFGRGLDTAVLATLPFVAAGFVAGTPYFETLAPWQPVFLNLAFGIILTTVLVSSFLVFLQDRRAGRAPVRPGAKPAAAAPPPARHSPPTAPMPTFVPAPRPAHHDEAYMTRIPHAAPPPTRPPPGKAPTKPKPVRRAK